MEIGSINNITIDSKEFKRNNPDGTIKQTFIFRENVFNVPPPLCLLFRNIYMPYNTNKLDLKIMETFINDNSNKLTGKK